jgi:uncharacterized protein YraI
MTIKNKLLTGAGLLVLSTGFALAAPAVVQEPVNLRAGPGVEFPVVTAIPGGAPIDVIGCEDAWCRVTFGRAVGFASRDYLALGGPRGPGYTTSGQGYEGRYAPGGSYYSEGVTTDYSHGYGSTGFGADVSTAVDGRGGADIRTENRGARAGVRTGASSNRNVSTETRTSAELTGNNPRKNYKSTHNPNLHSEGQAAALQGNNPMRNSKSTANPNLRSAGSPAAIKGNNPMKMPQSSTAATNQGSSRPSETTGAAPSEQRRR